MSDRSCAACGTQRDVTWNGIWQGQPADLCYDCWDNLIGLGDEEPTDEDLMYDFDWKE